MIKIWNAENAIDKDIWCGVSYSRDGATYFFTTDNEAVKKKFGYDVL